MCTLLWWSRIRWNRSKTIRFWNFSTYCYDNELFSFRDNEWMYRCELLHEMINEYFQMTVTRCSLICRSDCHHTNLLSIRKKRCTID